MKKIGIGYEKYKDFIDENIYYVDKTMLIKDLLERGGLVTLFTRPRRFGKTRGLFPMVFVSAKKYALLGRLNSMEL